MTPRTGVDPDTLSSKRREAMELSMRLQVELEPHTFREVLKGWSNYFGDGTPSPPDFRRFLRRTGDLIGHDTEVFSMLVEFLGGCSSIALKEAFAGKLSPNFLFLADRPISDVPRLPESPAARAYCNFMSAGMGQLVLKDHPSQPGSAMFSAVSVAQDWLQVDRIQSEPLFYMEQSSSDEKEIMTTKAAGRTWIELNNAVVCGYVAMQKSTLEASFEKLTTTLINLGWGDSATLLMLPPHKLLIKYALDAETLEAMKRDLHVAPQSTKAVEYEASNDFMDFILSQPNPLVGGVVPVGGAAPLSSDKQDSTPLDGVAHFNEKETPTTVPVCSVDDVHVLATTATTNDLATLRHELISTIARDYLVFPHRVAVGHQWADPGCYDVGDDTIVNALIDLRDMAFPTYMNNSMNSNHLMDPNEQYLDTNRIRDQWKDRLLPKWDQESNKYYTDVLMEARLDELEVAQHQMLMKRALKLLSEQHYKMLIKRLANFLSMSRTPTDMGIKNLYEELHFLFGIHFKVVRPLFDSLLPRLCVATLQDRGDMTRGKLKQEPTLVALGGWSQLHRDFQSILRMHMQLDARPIRGKQIRDARSPRTMRRDIWHRLRRTMLTDGQMSTEEFDDTVRKVWKEERDGRANMKLVYQGEARSEVYDEQEYDETTEEEDTTDDVSSGLNKDDIINPTSFHKRLELKKILLLNLPPYVTEKDIKAALPASEKIVRIDIHGDNMKNTLRTIKQTTKSHFNKRKMMELREKNMEVTNSNSFAMIEYDTAKSRDKARHRFLEYFGLTVRSKFKNRVEKDSNDGSLYNQLKQCLGKKPRRIVLYDKKTKKVKRTAKGYIRSVVAKDKNGEIILDPVLPLELTARCRIQEVSEMRHLHIRGVQSGSSGYQIAQTLSKIVKPHCNTGPIADMNGETGSISSRGRCSLWFPDHATAQNAYDAINDSANDDTQTDGMKTRIRAYWGPPRRKPTEMEIEFRKRIYDTIQKYEEKGTFANNEDTEGTMTTVAAESMGVERGGW
jgi:hypothetical protein